MVKRILITPGEPAGIGPDILLAVASQPWPHDLIAIADITLLEHRAKQLGLPLQFNAIDLDTPRVAHEPGRLKVLHVDLAAPCQPGKLDPQNARYVIQTLELATSLCLNHQAEALVTGPVQKSVMNAAGIPFSGHTEFLAERAGVSKTIMLFVIDHLKVALVTTHLPLTKVPSSITKELLQETLRLLSIGLQQCFGLQHPAIYVCGLNPHAGENGYLGDEEIKVISPTLETLREQGMNIVGPLPADTIFTPHYLEKADVILAMYHDQALPVVKSLGFHRAVNVTLGLPFVRTSVDHGTALDLAGSGKADAGSLAKAIELAIEIS